MALSSIPTISAVVNNPFTFNFNQSLLFFNPELEPFTMYFRIAGIDVLPYFVFQNFSNGTLQGFVNDNDVG